MASAKKEASDIRSFLNNKRVRGWLTQIVVVLLLAVLAGYGIYNAGVNLSSAGITTGFGFLSQPSGFDISQTLVEYSSNSTYARALVVGLYNTLLVSFLTIFFSTILGFFLGVIRLSPNWLISRMATALTEIIRNIPLLLQILFWYLAILTPLPGPRQAMHLGEYVYLCNRGLQIPKLHFEPGFGYVLASLALGACLTVVLMWWNRKRQLATGKRVPALPMGLALLAVICTVSFFAAGTPVQTELPALKGFNFKGGITVLPELIALLLALTLYAATFIGEFVRSGILAVEKGQREAAQALGYRSFLAYRLIIIPQAMRMVVPPLINQYLAIIKNSSLAIVIGYPDLIHVFAGTALNQSGQAVEIITITMAIYLVISLFISLIMNWYNKKFALRGH
ncbi:MAG: amino acid ABC transporter permease [Desulfobacterales bacterium]|nr:MAG: amino acid ABC transporter permease [Desulfobacterales bacterium]